MTCAQYQLSDFVGKLLTRYLSLVETSMCRRNKGVRASELLYNTQRMAGLNILQIFFFNFFSMGYTYMSLFCTLLVSLQSQGLVARSAGTTVLVERLFESLPVRRGDFIR